MDREDQTDQSPGDKQPSTDNRSPPCQNTVHSNVGEQQEAGEGAVSMLSEQGPLVNEKTGIMSVGEEECEGVPILDSTSGTDGSALNSARKKKRVRHRRKGVNKKIAAEIRDDKIVVFSKLGGSEEFLEYNDAEASVPILAESDVSSVATPRLPSIIMDKVPSTSGSAENLQGEEDNEMEAQSTSSETMVNGRCVVVPIQVLMEKAKQNAMHFPTMTHNYCRPLFMPNSNLENENDWISIVESPRTVINGPVFTTSVPAVCPVIYETPTVSPIGIHVEQMNDIVPQRINEEVLVDADSEDLDYSENNEVNVIKDEVSEINERKGQSNSSEVEMLENSDSDKCTCCYREQSLMVPIQVLIDETPTQKHHEGIHVEQENDNNDVDFQQINDELLVAANLEEVPDHSVAVEVNGIKDEVSETNEREGQSNFSEVEMLENSDSDKCTCCYREQSLMVPIQVLIDETPTQKHHEGIHTEQENDNNDVVFQQINDELLVAANLEEVSDHSVADEVNGIKDEVSETNEREGQSSSSEVVMLENSDSDKCTCCYREQSLMVPIQVLIDATPTQKHHEGVHVEQENDNSDVVFQQINDELLAAANLEEVSDHSVTDEVNGIKDEASEININDQIVVNSKLREYEDIVNYNDAVASVPILVVDDLISVPTPILPCIIVDKVHSSAVSSEKLPNAASMTRSKMYQVEEKAIESQSTSSELVNLTRVVPLQVVIPEKPTRAGPLRGVHVEQRNGVLSQRRNEDVLVDADLEDSDHSDQGCCANFIRSRSKSSKKKNIPAVEGERKSRSRSIKERLSSVAVVARRTFSKH